MKDNDTWLTVNEAAKLSNYHPERIRELIREKKIVAQKFSIVWQVNRRSLIDFLEKTQLLGKKRGPKVGG